MKIESRLLQFADHILGRYNDSVKRGVESEVRKYRERYKELQQQNAAATAAAITDNDNVFDDDDADDEDDDEYDEDVEAAEPAPSARVIRQ
jgi:hypothetical protein